MREIRMLRTTWRELETELRDGLRHRHEAKAAGKRLLPVPTATAPALDPTGGGLAGAIPPGYPDGVMVTSSRNPTAAVVSCLGCGFYRVLFPTT